ncbi:MAG: HEAT repeat domain-containing protein [Anaerolineae bacterium]|nr:HEAT repeat domain-containing protein [Anaerolineae bacterium]
MAKKEISFNEALAFLREGAKPDPKWLRGFNDLDKPSLAAFQSAWMSLSADPRAKAAQALHALMQEDIEMHFGAAFRPMLSDANPRVRLTAISGLMEDEGQDLVEPLIHLMRNDPEESVRAAAAGALGRFAILAETDRLTPARKRMIYEAVLKVFRTEEESSPVYRNALESLAYTSNDVIAMYIRAAYASDDEALRTSAIVAMGRSQDRQFSEFVREELQNVSPKMRLEAARAIGELEDADAMPELSKLIDDTDMQVREAALESLAVIGGEPARSLLQAAVLSEDEELVTLAEHAIETYDFWHGEIDFSLTDIDEDVLKPRRVWQRKATAKGEE